MGVERTHPVCQLDCLFRQLLQHLAVHLWKVEDVFDAILSVVRVQGAFHKQTDISLGPHLVKLVLVLVHPVRCLVLLQNFI